MSAPGSTKPRVLGLHPELGHLVLLSHQLDILVSVLTQVHGGGGQPEALTRHARGMVRVIRTLQHELDAYEELLHLLET